MLARAVALGQRDGTYRGYRPDRTGSPAAADLRAGRDPTDHRHPREPWLRRLGRGFRVARATPGMNPVSF